MTRRFPRQSFALSVGSGIALAAGVLAIMLGGCGGHATAGALDTSFGTSGKVLTTYCCVDDDVAHASASAVAIGSDGKIVVAGGFNGPQGLIGLALALYTTSGHVDRQVQSLDGVAADALAIQPDGKIVVASAISDELARYTTSGKLDTSFGTGGKVQTDVLVPDAVAIQPDGKIVVAGYSFNGGNSDIAATAFALARYTTSGKLDTSFGTGGMAQTDFGSESGGTAVAIQPDGKIVVAGAAHRHLDTYDWALARYTMSGKLDTSFGAGGKVPTDFGSLGYGPSDVRVGVVIQSDGKIVVAGGSKPHDFALARYTTSGRLDTSFATGGMVQTDFGSESRANAVAIEPDGRIVVAGYSGAAFALARYATSGTLDTSFGTGGKVVTHFRASGAAYAVAIEPDGKIVVVGDAGGDFALARYLP